MCGDLIAKPDFTILSPSLISPSHRKTLIFLAAWLVHAQVISKSAKYSLFDPAKEMVSRLALMGRKWV